MSDAVNPSHYKNYRVEVIDILEDAASRAPNSVMSGNQWQVLKYMLRLWDKSNPLEDARKAKWYLDRLITHLETSDPNTGPS